MSENTVDASAKVKTTKLPSWAIYLIVFLSGATIVFFISVLGPVIFIQTILDSLFTIGLILGSLLIIGLLIWYGYYFYSRNHLEKAIEKDFITRCLVCRNEIEKRSITFTSKAGFPSGEIELACSKCHTRIESKFPFKKFEFAEVNPDINPDIAWLYSGETVTEKELETIATGSHTEKAYGKIRSRMLAEISAGGLDRVFKLTPELIKAPDTKVVIGDNPYLELRLQKDEELFITFSPVVLGVLRSRDNQYYIKRDDLGKFFISSKRFGFVGINKSNPKPVTHLEDVSEENKQLKIFRKNRKTPEYYSNIDIDLVISIFEGLGVEL